MNTHTCTAWPATKASVERCMRGTGEELVVQGSQSDGGALTARRASTGGACLAETRALKKRTATIRVRARGWG